MNVNKFKKMMEENPMIKASNGRNIRFREYLDEAIKAYNLKDGDYFSAYVVLTAVANGHDAKIVISRLMEMFKKLDAALENQHNGHCSQRS